MINFHIISYNFILCTITVNNIFREVTEAYNLHSAYADGAKRVRRRTTAQN